MALYGVDFYGASHYGPRIYLDFDAGPMVATAVGSYESLYVTWTSPGGSWSRMRLVRNSYGVPVSEEDGAILFDINSGPTAAGTIDPSVTRWTDVGLEGGRFAYYAIWLYSTATAEWVRAAYCTGLALRDYGYHDRLWELTPAVLRTKTVGLLDETNDQLRSFEGIFGYQLDEIRATYETLRDVNDPERVAGGLLPVMAQQYGQFFEPELGMKQMRLLLQNTVHLYRTKGTIPGVEGFVSAISGYGADVQPLKNLMLDYNDSSAEEDTGRWHNGTNATLARYVADDVINSVPDAIGSTMRNAGIMQVTAATAAFTQAQCGTQNALYYGTPVVGGTTYTFSTYARSGAAGAPGVTLRIFYYDAAGVYITENAGAATAVTDTAWTRVACTYAAPTNAAYACVGVEWTATAAGQITYFDAMQFEAGTAPTPYTDARLIDVFVRASRVNLITNPNFETDTAGWGANNGATLTRDTSRSHSGAASLLVTTVATNQYQGTSWMLPVTAGTTYTASAWVYITAGMPPVQITVNSTPTGYVAGDTTTTTGSWQRVAVTFTAVSSGTGNINIQENTGWVGVAGQQFNVDDVLVEAAADVRPYFDGTTYAFIGDSIWEGAANASRSHYYPQRRTKNYRMQALLPDYTPMGSSFRLLYAQPL